MRSPTDTAEDVEAAPARTTRVLDLGLLLVGVLGAASVVWFLLSTWLGLGFVSFATGSMGPDYPAGSVAMSASVGLADIHPGDVVTVDRGARLLPITHRVVGVELHPTAKTATLQLKGDANRYPDPLPYVVSGVRRVVLPLPYVGELVRLVSAPIGLGVAAMLISGSVLWAIWPVRRDVDA